MVKKKAIITAITTAILVCVIGVLLSCNQAPSVTQTPSGNPARSLTHIVTGETVERPKVYQQEIRIAIGDRLILGKVTDELADLGTIKEGDSASYEIVISNGEDEPVEIIARVSGNISALITFDYDEIIEPQSSGVITVNISGDVQKGPYTGVIVVERVNED